MSVTINPVNVPVQGINTKGNKQPRLVSVSEGPDFISRTYEVDASSGKKCGVGLASFFLTGLGQAINGDWGKGAAFFGGSILAGGAMLASSVLIQNSLVRGKKPNSNTAIMLCGLGLVASLGLKIGSILDAVKGAKTEIIQVVPKNISQNVGQKVSKTV